MKAMMQRNGHLLLALAALILTAGLVSWDQYRSPQQYGQQLNDTTPKKKSADRDKKVRDLDDVLDELNDADMKVDREKIRQNIEEAMRAIDMDKIKADIEKAMKEVDIDKIRQEVEASLAKVDFDKIKTRIAEAMKEFDGEKIKQQIRESMEKVDWDNIKEEMKKVKDIDMKKMQEEMEKAREEMKEIQPRIEKEMEKARTEIEKAKVEIRAYKEFVDGLDKDGLINKKEGYTLKHKEGELFINGKKAPESVYNKYRAFLEKHKQFSIDKSDDDFDIDMD